MGDKVNPDFWQGKKVLITGHTGFKGSWLSLWLQSLGSELAGYALAPSTEPSLFHLAGVADGMISILGDLADLDRLQQAVAEHQPDIIIHMAAQPLVRKSYEDPVTTYQSNVMGTVHLLEAVRQVGGVRAVVSVTSDKCYENREWIWGYRENEALGGYDPYSSSKGCAELVTAAYRNSFFHPGRYAEHGVALASARAGNVIGGGDWSEDRLIPDILKSLLQGQRVLIRNPGAIRPWQHVLEPLGAYLMLAERLYEEGPNWGEAWNFGPHDADARPVSWIADALHARWGSGLSWERDASPQPHEATYLKLDCSKARARLGWEPKLDLDEALTWIVSWTKAYASGADMGSVTRTQVQEYINL